MLGQGIQIMSTLRVGYELVYECPQPTPMILMLNIHHTRIADLIVPDTLTTTPAVPIAVYEDVFGNRCSRIVAPIGEIRISADGVVRDTGVPDIVADWAQQQPVRDLPEEVLVFLLGSRYCETDKLSQVAWNLFGYSPTGWGRVQAICDFVHRHVAFGYEHANPTKSAWEVFNQGQGVCRDYAHLAVTFCRCMNIPARYCTGYLSDIGTLPPYGVGDFAGWFEAFLGGQWYTFDPRNNVPRVGRVLMARGRDAADVPISNTFGFNTLNHFKVWTDEVSEASL
jgi:transglutaminase-like putative cysteine protease